MPDGYQCDWYYVDTPPSVMIVPLTTDGNLVLVRQYRHNLNAHVPEFPAGTVTDGEDPESAGAPPVVRRCAAWLMIMGHERCCNPLRGP